MTEMCSVCPAAERCPYFGQDSYYWNQRGEDRCDEIISEAINRTRKEFYAAWLEYINDDD